MALAALQSTKRSGTVFILVHAGGNALERGRPELTSALPLTTMAFGAWCRPLGHDDAKESLRIPWHANRTSLSAG